MAHEPMQGIFPILLTPFTEHGEIDEEDLRQEIEYNVSAGVHGLGVALGSEIFKFSETERERVIRIVVDQTRSRVPVVINTGAMANYPAILYSKQAEELGAAAVMCTPPIGITASETRSYFKAISDAVRVPIFIQDTAAATVPAPLIRQIAEESERVRYAKIESQPPALRVYQAVQASKGLVTIFGGAGAMTLLEELRRGSVGTMGWADTPHAFVKIWNAWRAGDAETARAVWENEIAPIGRLGAGGLRQGHQIHKEILRRRGIFKTSHVRAPADPLDEITQRELDEVCERLRIR
jgi:dihydrodipicolinate synthase/N-acetylneuraminate lyase